MGGDRLHNSCACMLHQIVKNQPTPGRRQAESGEEYLYLDFANELLLTREALQLKQEGLAKRLDVARQTISLYETGKLLPSAEMVVLMAKRLNAPLLEWEWLRANPVGLARLPKIPDLSLSECYLNLYCSTIQTVKMHRDLADICRDNRIEPHEMPVYLTGNVNVKDMVSYGLCFINKKTTFAEVAN